MSHAAQGYRSYLLRLWRVRGEDAAAWRASLESPLTGERWGFAGPEEMYAFLRRQIGLAPEQGGEEHEATIRSEQGGI